MIFLEFFFLAVLGLHCCTRAFSSCSKQGLLFAAVRGLLTAEASLVVAHRLVAHRLRARRRPQAQGAPASAGAAPALGGLQGLGSGEPAQ